MNSAPLDGNFSEADIETEAARLRSLVAQPGVPIVAFIGGLDASKRIDFLAKALENLEARNVPVHVAVGGLGPDACLLGPLQKRGRVTMLGHVGGLQKAALLRSARAVLNPGRVGLLAVDALAAGRPILTTEWAFHAPEIEYLVDGQSLFKSANDPDAFAQLIESTVAAPVLAQQDWSYPTMTDMISNFASGVRTMLTA
ncbi:glycosyltransferase [Microbacterium sp. CnD16-F]|uniref:glycosyltransferase n=1 Tax=Microbacterium sp. CnD16-F TaxID=2954493 RepID=UPI002097891B|nr:glycosyltransferase [Microbacterium sp. CnD16-F]MCO7203587.1 glycosyltransferase [Microbacterium sp. CnD16-F]